MGYIYCITNKINNKKYIGKTEYENPKKRWQEHLRDSERFDRLLYRAIRKYGKENFIFEVLFSDLYGEELCEKEISTIKEYDTYSNGYNATLGGDGASYILEEEKKRIVFDYNNGMSTYKIAQKYNHDQSTISRILKSNGINPNENYNYHSSKNNCPIKMYNDKEELIFNSSKECIDYIHENISNYSKESIRKGLSKALNGTRKSYLKYKFERLNKED